MTSIMFWVKTRQVAEAGLRPSRKAQDPAGLTRKAGSPGFQGKKLMWDTDSHGFTRISGVVSVHPCLSVSHFRPRSEGPAVSGRAHLGQQGQRTAGADAPGFRRAAGTQGHRLFPLRPAGVGRGSSRRASVETCRCLELFRTPALSLRSPAWVSSSCCAASLERSSSRRLCVSGRQRPVRSDTVAAPREAFPWDTPPLRMSA